MLCEKCKKNEATVFVQQIINGEKKEHYLCPSCSATSYTDVSFENIFNGFLSSIVNSFGTKVENPTKDIWAKKCAVCGLTFDDIRKNGKIGCVDCYETFREEMADVIKNVQGSTTHIGKYPQKSGAHLLRERQIEELRQQLTEKVKHEAYEEAAQIRDKIKALEGGAQDAEVV